MVRISILTLKNAVLASISDACYAFTMVNQFLTEQGREPLFEVQLAGLVPEVLLNNGLFAIRPDVLLEEERQPDLVIIPALAGDMVTATHMNREYGHWIAHRYKHGAAVASLCTGAFLLAFSGLLKGRQCTTHWKYGNEFRHYYPTVQLVEEKMITDQHDLYSSGGSNAYWNLLLHLIEKYAGRDMAIRAAKYFVIDIDKKIQSPFIVFQGLKDHEDEVIRNAQEYIEHNYEERLTVDEIARRFNTTRRTFERRFRKATRHAVTEYIQKVKVEASKKQLEVGRKSIAEIMMNVGYSDSQAFRDVFKRVTGMTPVHYRNKYNMHLKNER